MVTMNKLINYDFSSFRQSLYGPNVIDVDVKSYVRLFFEEVLIMILNKRLHTKHAHGGHVYLNMHFL